jgi:hypothetical protein
MHPNRFYRSIKLTEKTKGDWFMEWL